MFDYFRNYSSNAHQVCCEDSPTKGLYDHCQSDDLDLHSRSQVRLKSGYFLTCNISDNISAITFKLGMTVDLYGAYMITLYSMTLTLMQGHSGSANVRIQYWIISTTKQAMSIKLATTVGHFMWPWLRDVYMDWLSCFSFFSFSSPDILPAMRWIRRGLRDVLTIKNGQRSQGWNATKNW